MTKREKRVNGSLGWMDLCRVDDAGEVSCQEPGELGPEKRKPRLFPVDKQDPKSVRHTEKMAKKGDWGPSSRNTGTPRWGAKGSSLLTSTSKVHTATWSVPMGATCPRVRDPIVAWFRDSITDKDLLKPKEAIKRLLKEIPQKCLACYAMSDNYPQKQTQNAMARRRKWFENMPDKQVEDTLVEAIKHAGEERCKKGQECIYVPGVQPKFFRAFDSGDFADSRAVNIWYNVAKRLPGTRFWFPTTAWDKPCGPLGSEDRLKMISALKKLHALPHVTVRPSAYTIDAPAVAPPGLGVGTTVVEPTPAKKFKQVISKKGELEKIRICPTGPVKMDGKAPPAGCADHFICPGNCGWCRRCWNKKDRVVYVRHGLTAQARNILELVNRTVGTHIPPFSDDPSEFLAPNKLIQEQFFRLVHKLKALPAGAEGRDLVLPRFPTRTRRELRAGWTKASKKKAKKFNWSERKRLQFLSKRLAAAKKAEVLPEDVLEMN